MVLWPCTAVGAEFPAFASGLKTLNNISYTYGPRISFDGEVDDWFESSPFLGTVSKAGPNSEVENVRKGQWSCEHAGLRASLGPAGRCSGPRSRVPTRNILWSQAER